MILKGRLKMDFLFQTTFLSVFQINGGGKRGNTLCNHYFCFDRGG